MPSLEEINVNNAENYVTRVNDLIEVWNLKSGAGKRVLIEIINESGVNGSSYDRSGQLMAFNVGKADLGRTIIENLTHAGIELTTREMMGLTKKDIQSKFNQKVNTVKKGGYE